MEIHPIKTEADCRAALREIESLMDAAPGSEAEDKLDVLATLVQAYESKHYPVLPPDPIEAIQYRMACQGLTRKDLIKSIGGPGRVSEVLNRKRPLSIEMIRATSELLDIPTEILIRPYATQKPASFSRKARSNKSVDSIR